METITVILSVSGIIVAIIIAIYQMKKSETIVQQTGQMKKPDLDCYFISEQIKDIPVDSYCLWYPGGKESMAAFYLVFCVHNKGDAAAEGSILLIKASSFCLSDDDSFITEKISPRVLSGDVKRSVEKVKGEVQISYKLPVLYQHSTFHIIEPFLFSETFFESTFDAELKDKATASFTARAAFSFPITITLVNKNELHKCFSLTIECYHGENMEEVGKKYLTIRSKDKKELIGKDVAIKKTMLLNYDIDRVLSHDGKNIYLMKNIMDNDFVDGCLLEYLVEVESKTKIT
jgi:hypothetical protein